VAAAWVLAALVGSVLDAVGNLAVLALVATGAVVAFQVVRSGRAHPASTAHVGASSNSNGGTTMWESVKRWWKYLAVKLRVLHEEHADPKVQLEQAIDEAMQTDRRLRDQAANVIAHQRQAQVRLDKAVAEYRKANGTAEQALLLADRAASSGDEADATRLGAAAERMAARVLLLETQIGELEQQLLQATAHADQARAAVEQNGVELKRKLEQKEELLSKLDRANVQESLNHALESLSLTVGADVPTFAEVSDKIDRKLAKAEATGELTATRIESSTTSVIRDVEQAQRSAEARVWLAERRAKLGLVTDTVVEPGTSTGTDTV
jgi:phage shock protein A